MEQKTGVTADPLLVETVAETLHCTGLPPSALELEVTETVLARDMSVAKQTLGALWDLGVAVAIDDFGTGYSSLSYLRTLPVDRIKIDQSFVRDLHVSSDASKITETILTLSKALNLKTIAEGVETTAQEEWLKQRGCEEAQGYLYAKPCPVGVFEAYLAGRRDAYRERVAATVA